MMTHAKALLKIILFAIDIFHLLENYHISKE